MEEVCYSPDCIALISGTYLEANHGCNNRVEDTNYETEEELGKRNRRKPSRLESSESSDDQEEGDSFGGPSTCKRFKPRKKAKQRPMLKESTRYVPPPPPIAVSMSGRFAASPPKIKRCNIAVQKCISSAKKSPLREFEAFKARSQMVAKRPAIQNCGKSSNIEEANKVEELIHFEGAKRNDVRDDLLKKIQGFAQKSTQSRCRGKKRSANKTPDVEEAREVIDDKVVKDAHEVNAEKGLNEDHEEGCGSKGLEKGNSEEVNDNHVEDSSEVSLGPALKDKEYNKTQSDTEAERGFMSVEEGEPSEKNLFTDSEYQFALVCDLLFF